LERPYEREGTKRTGLDAGAVLLVREELAQLSLVLLGELVEIGLVDGELLGGHCGLRFGGC